MDSTGLWGARKRGDLLMTQEEGEGQFNGRVCHCRLMWPGSLSVIELAEPN